MSQRNHAVETRFAQCAIGVLLLAAMSPVTAHAQTAQMFSVQFSALGAYPFGGGLENVTSGYGWEAQVRLNPSSLSIGAGAEQTFHEVSGVTGRDIVFFGGFVEPRYLVDVGSERAILYLSARAALSQIELKQAGTSSTGTGYTLNGGGGLLYILGSRVNFDVGATIGYKDLGSIDLPTGTFDLGTGTNVVARVGLAIGIG